MAGVINTSQAFANGDSVTSTKLNAIATGSYFTSDAITGTGLTVTGGGTLSLGTVASSNMGANSVLTASIGDSQVTSAKLASSVIFVPSGAVMAFAMNSAPTGWLSAEGTAVSRSTYANLFAAIGTTYGSGDGSTTFNLPDLRGYFVRGSGTNSDGTIAGTFATKQADQFQGHYHTSTLSTGTTGSPYTTPLLGNGSGSGVTSYAQTIATDGTNGTPRVGTETRPRNIPMLYCIKI